MPTHPPIGFPEELLISTYPPIGFLKELHISTYPPIESVGMPKKLLILIQQLVGA